jgi:hypothetical protein
LIIAMSNSGISTPTYLLPMEFKLVPFDRSKLTDGITITGEIDCSGATLKLSYVIAGDLSQIEILPPQRQRHRKWELWLATCCEFFLAVGDRADYWEFNLAPTGEWNVFHLDGYRQGLTEETKIGDLPFQVHHIEDRLMLNLELDLSQMVTDSEPIKLGITAVIASPTGEMDYWALRHPGKEADFHLRESFGIEL